MAHIQGRHYLVNSMSMDLYSIYSRVFYVAWPKKNLGACMTRRYLQEKIVEHTIPPIVKKKNTAKTRIENPSNQTKQGVKIEKNR